jgi:hypothetical protein
MVVFFCGDVVVVGSVTVTVVTGMVSVAGVASSVVAMVIFIY